jgi:hypothetical protein
MKEILKYNWHLIALIVVILLTAIIARNCKKDDILIEESPKEYIDSLLVENKILNALSEELKRKRIEDSVSLTKEITYYKNLKRKERIVYVGTKVGGTLQDQDTLTCFNDNQLDSVGVISIERDYCYKDRDNLIRLNSIKDTLIFNSDKALSKSLVYSNNLEVRYNSLRKDRDKQINKKIRNRKIAVIATLIAISEGVLLFLK